MNFEPDTPHLTDQSIFRTLYRTSDVTSCRYLPVQATVDRTSCRPCCWGILAAAGVTSFRLSCVMCSLSNQLILLTIKRGLSTNGDITNALSDENGGPFTIHPTRLKCTQEDEKSSQ